MMLYEAMPLFAKSTDSEKLFSLLGGGVLFFLAGLVLFFIVLVIAIYVYTSFAFMTIARKVKYSAPGIAWIPLVGPLLITSKTAKMHWWPILLIILFPIPVVNVLAMIVLTVFAIIWLWKTYEKLNRPGWWALFNLIRPVNLVFYGIAAWGKK